MKNLSLFILDDDSLILDVVQAMLESMGVVNIATHTSARLALPMLDLKDPDLVLLCDLNMPDMDGVEVLRYLGQQEFLGAVILLSGEDARTLQIVVNIGYATHLRLLGALGKPVDQHALMSMLQQAQGSVKRTQLAHALTVSELSAGMDANALLAYFQPQVDVHSRKVVGVEALARWQHPQFGILDPGAFIPVAEQNGMIARLTEQMLVHALRQWRQWHDSGLDLTVSVNISMHSLNDVTFPDRLITEALGVPLEFLMLEITESQLSQDIIISSDVLARLCLKRIRLSIDDFGTAYSNMEKLQLLPFFELKIDRAFVHGAAKNSLSHAILKSSAELGHKLSMQTVAEGVETQEDWDCVADLGCDLIQGFYVAHPMPGDQLASWLSEWESQ